MRSINTSTSSSSRHRRIGRKVLRADRIAKALSPTPPAPTKLSYLLLLRRPKVLAVASVLIISIGLLGYGGYSVVASQITTAQEMQAAKDLKVEQEKSVAADACRREKVEQKADLIGKVTYDELYDNDECDK